MTGTVRARAVQCSLCPLLIAMTSHCGYAPSSAKSPTRSSTLWRAGSLGVAQRRERTVGTEHDRVLERAALREPALDQRLDLVQEAERAVRRDVARYVSGRDLGLDVLRPIGAG